jgi:hypothetical protein
VLCVLYGCVTWSHVLTEGCRLRAFENGMPRKIFRSKMENRPKKAQVIGKRENCIIWSFMKRSTQNILFGSSNKGG